MQNEFNPLHLIDDTVWKYKLCITTLHKYTNKKVYKPYEELQKHYSVNCLIKRISKITRNLLETKYKNKIKHSDIEPIKKHLLAVAVFEPRTSDLLIHFHYLISSFVKPRFMKDISFITSLEREVCKVYTKQLKNSEKLEQIYNFKLENYIPYNDYLMLYPNSNDYRNYIYKYVNNQTYLTPFFSLELNNLIKLKTYEHK